MTPFGVPLARAVPVSTVDVLMATPNCDEGIPDHPSCKAYARDVAVRLP